MMMKQCLSTIEYFQKEQNPYLLSLTYQIFKEKKW